MIDYTTRNLIPAANLAELYLQNAAHLFDIQAAASQRFFRQYAEAFRVSAEQTAAFTRQTGQRVHALQNEVNEYVARQTAVLTRDPSEIAPHVEQSTDIARAAAERAESQFEQGAQTANTVNDRAVATIEENADIARAAAERASEDVQQAVSGFEGSRSTVTS